VAEGEVLSAPLVLEYPFRRTVGRVQSAFLTGLREGIVLGIRARDGRVVCPPVEYDPVTGDELDEIVQVGEEGTVTTWSWEPEGRPNQPLDHDFAWALVRLDGADTALLHAVDAGAVSAMTTGMRVRIRWRVRADRQGDITDIACFEPTGDAADRAGASDTGNAGDTAGAGADAGAGNPR
jgi:hypothetical protein